MDRVLTIHGLGDSENAPWQKEIRSILEGSAQSVDPVEIGVLNTLDSPRKQAGFMAAEIEQKEEKDLALVGHHTGGLAARYAAEEMGYGEFIDKIITISTPHKGTKIARYVPKLPCGLNDLSEGSEFIEGLNYNGLSDDIEYLNLIPRNDISQNTNKRLPKKGKNDEDLQVEVGIEPPQLFYNRDKIYSAISAGGLTGLYNGGMINRILGDLSFSGNFTLIYNETAQETIEEFLEN